MWRLQFEIKNEIGLRTGDAIFIYIKVNFSLCVHAKYTLKQDRRGGKMNWKEIAEQIREVIRQIKINFPVTFDLFDTINVDIYGMAYPIPEGTDTKAIADTVHKPESEDLIVQNVIMKLEGQHPQIFNMPAYDIKQLITTSTIESIIEWPIISEKVAVGESVKVKLSPGKSINDENET